MGKKLIGLLKSPTGIVHAQKEKDLRKAFCGYKDGTSDSIPYSGRSHITCEKCRKALPQDIF